MLERRKLEAIFNREDHTYSDSYGVEYPSVTRILNHAKLCDFSMVPEYYRDKGLKRGSAVHWITQLEDEGALNYRKLTKQMRGYRMAWKAFKAASGFVPMEIERPFIDSRGFAGTPDRKGTLPPTLQIPYKSLAIVDIKTGRAVMDYVRYQISAYASHHGGINALRRIGVALHDDGTYKVREFPLDTALHDLSVFLEALKRYKRDHAL
jgi:hypothetical protein